METCLPSLDRLAGSFRSKCKMNDRSALHFVDYAKCNIAAALSVYRNTSKLAKEPAKRSPEHFSLDHAVRLATYRYIIEVRNHKVPDGGVRDSKNDAFVFRDYWVNGCPA
jgi:hypothetical protein